MNRRKFLQTAGIALGALALPAAADTSLSAPSQPTKPDRLTAWMDDELTPRGDNVGYIEVGPEFIEVYYKDGSIQFIRG